MNTQIIKPSLMDPNHDDFLRAGVLIREGKLVAFPTETVYGLGANALDGNACDKIFEAKGRPHDNPLIVHVLNPEEFDNYCETDHPLFPVLAKRFMPGPLTIILPKKNTIPDSVTVGLNTVALRCPSHPVARALIEAAGVPIAAPSANLSGKPSPTTAEHVIADMNGRIDMIIDGGCADVGLESTVISLKDDGIHLLRPGFVTYEDLLTVTDQVIISPAVLEMLKSTDRPESPGMKYRHYAPEASVTMVSGREEKVIDFFREKLSKGCGILCFDEDLELLSANHPNVLSFGSKYDLASQANRLFDALRSFDRIDVKEIYARQTSTHALGLAISNRLLRACAFKQIEV